MIVQKKQQLYAKSVMNGIGHLDDDLILEARENEPTSVESTAFNIKKYAVGVAAFLLLFGALVLFPYLIGGKKNSILPILWNAGSQNEIKVAVNSTETLGDYSLTFTGIDGVSVFYFRPDTLPAGCRVLMSGETLPMEDGYYVVDLSSLPDGTSTVTVLLSGLTEEEADAIRITTRLSDSQKTKTDHPVLNG